MSRIIRFTKMHGRGNDYIYVNSSLYPIKNPSVASVKWSNRHKGIGADGLVLIGKSTVADFSMRIFNADGTEAMMCGNACRCIGKFVYENALTRKSEISLETLSGIKHLILHISSNKVESVTVDMGIPSLSNHQQVSTIDGSLLKKEFKVNGLTYYGTYVCVGNPHLVIFVEDVESVPLSEIGPILENHQLFPQKTNVEFAEIKPDGSIRMRVWERGSGITQACGTGACATVFAAISTNKVQNEVLIHMDGGDLQVYWDNIDKHIYMRGSAEKVFDGTIELDE